MWLAALARALGSTVSTPPVIFILSNTLLNLSLLHSTFHLLLPATAQQCCYNQAAGTQVPHTVSVSGELIANRKSFSCVTVKPRHLYGLEYSDVSPQTCWVIYSSLKHGWKLSGCCSTHLMLGCGCSHKVASVSFLTLIGFYFTTSSKQMCTGYALKLHLRYATCQDLVPEAWTLFCEFYSQSSSPASVLGRTLSCSESHLFSAA